MRGFTKVYTLNVDGIEFYVRECAGSEALLFLEYYQWGHLYNRTGFTWDEEFQRNLGSLFCHEVYKAFDKCEHYLSENPRPWINNPDLPCYEEPWGEKVKPFAQTRI